MAQRYTYKQIAKGIPPTAPNITVTGKVLGEETSPQAPDIDPVFLDNGRPVRARFYFQLKTITAAPGVDLGDLPHDVGDIAFISAALGRICCKRKKSGAGFNRAPGTYPELAPLITPGRELRLAGVTYGTLTPYNDYPVEVTGLDFATDTLHVYHLTNDELETHRAWNRVGGQFRDTFYPPPYNLPPPGPPQRVIVNVEPLYPQVHGYQLGPNTYGPMLGIHFTHADMGPVGSPVLSIPKNRLSGLNDISRAYVACDKVYCPPESNSGYIQDLSDRYETYYY